MNKIILQVYLICPIKTINIKITAVQKQKQNPNNILQKQDYCI